MKTSERLRLSLQDLDMAINLDVLHPLMKGEILGNKKVTWLSE